MFVRLLPYLNNLLVDFLIFILHGLQKGLERSGVLGVEDPIQKIYHPLRVLCDGEDFLSVAELDDLVLL